MDTTKSDVTSEPNILRSPTKICVADVLFQVRLDHNSNSTNSILNFVPRVEDGGKFLKCRAENVEMAASQIEDSWNLEINCKMLAGRWLGGYTLFYFMMTQISHWLSCHSDQTLMRTKLKKVTTFISNAASRQNRQSTKLPGGSM